MAAKKVIERDGCIDRKSLVLSSEDWHPGVIGIVASRITEEYGRPCILIALDKDIGKGSARSISGFHMYEGLRECAAHLLGFGGHKYAAGLKINRDKIQAFQDIFEEIVRRKLEHTDFTPTISIDAELDLEEITPELLHYLSLLSPYGSANSKPIFATMEKLPIFDLRILGKDTLKFMMEGKKGMYEVIGFGMGHLSSQLPSEVRIAFHPKMNDWQGVKRLQLELKAVNADHGDGPFTTFMAS
jgi:single-stranded-DNA-specific exonuclease